MKLTKGIITREEALKISKDYVDFVEGDFNIWDEIIKPFEKMKRGHKAVTFSDGKFVMVKVSSVDHDSFMAEDGPVVRVSNGEYSWRVDGAKYAYPIKIKTKA